MSEGVSYPNKFGVCFLIYPIISGKLLEMLVQLENYKSHAQQIVPMTADAVQIRSMNLDKAIKKSHLIHSCVQPKAWVIWVFISFFLWMSVLPLTRHVSWLNFKNMNWVIYRNYFPLLKILRIFWVTREHLSAMDLERNHVTLYKWMFWKSVENTLILKIFGTKSYIHLEEERNLADTVSRKFYLRLKSSHAGQKWWHML